MPMFQSSGYSLAYESTGAGPVVLCIHGFASSGKVNWIDTGWTETGASEPQAVQVVVGGWPFRWCVLRFAESLAA